MSQRVLGFMFLVLVLPGCHLPRSTGDRWLLGVGAANIVGGSLLVAMPDTTSIPCESDEAFESRGACYVLHHLDAVGVFMIALGIGNVAMAYTTGDSSGPPNDTAADRRAGAIRHDAASGRCEKVAFQYRELRDHDQAAAAEIALDDDVRTCLIVQDARERGLIR